MRKLTVVIAAVLLLTTVVVSFFLFSKTVLLISTTLPESCHYSFECGIENKAACIGGICVRCKKIIDYKSLFGKIVLTNNDNGADSLYFEMLMLNPDTRECFVVPQKDQFSSDYANFTDVSEIGLLREQLDMLNDTIT